ncbi:hypothetical protein CP556_18800 [Natrinema sp. CBA1119]|uniref:O-antigen ligase family protein n=1 Tax=Natrinema sp. CBA1119 TaxID=1608465 RepID=UPI000BF302E3|nr:O-antigen ligase family protein [Natrinema sp. CBA1119]PGF17949.1 hypothetical protein CP556_18800 [Natrinema sp. CBA1119]
MSAALLITLFVFVVPSAAIVTDISVTRLLIAAATTYVLAIYSMKIVFEGICAATIVLAVFNITAVVTGSHIGGRQIRIVDVLLVGTLCCLLVRQQYDSLSNLGNSGRLTIGSFLLFVLWTFLAGVVGNGPSSTEAFLYAQTQLRYGLLLITAALLVGTTDVRSVIYPLVYALGGALVFAVDEVFSGKSGYPSHLGVLGVELQQIWPAPSLTSFPVDSTVLYVGPPIGQSRIMVGMAIFFIPLVVAAVAQSRVHTALSVAGSLGIVSVLASSSHSGMLAMYAVIGIVLLYWFYRVLGRYGLYRARSMLVPLSVLIGATVIAWTIAATAAGRDEILLIRTNNLNVRLRQYAAAIDIAARYPVFGIGGGENFERVVNSRWGVHNLFLANLVATGVPGFLTYVISVTTATWIGIQQLVRCPVDEKWIWVGILAAMVGFYTYSFWTIAFQRESLNAIYWILAGSVVGASWRATSRDH